MENQETTSNFLRNYWPIILVVVSIIAQWSVLGLRIGNVEARQDRQSEAIMQVQKDIVAQAVSTGKLEAKIDAIGDSVSYIRSRIDAVTK